MYIFFQHCSVNIWPCSFLLIQKDVRLDKSATETNQEWKNYNIRNRVNERVSLARPAEAVRDWQNGAIPKANLSAVLLLLNKKLSAYERKLIQTYIRLCIWSIREWRSLKKRSTLSRMYVHICTLRLRSILWRPTHIHAHRVRIHRRRVNKIAVDDDVTTTTKNSHRRGICNRCTRRATIERASHDVRTTRSKIKKKKKNQSWNLVLSQKLRAEWA